MPSNRLNYMQGTLATVVLAATLATALIVVFQAMPTQAAPSLDRAWLRIALVVPLLMMFGAVIAARPAIASRLAWSLAASAASLALWFGYQAGAAYFSLDPVQTKELELILTILILGGLGTNLIVGLDWALCVLERERRAAERDSLTGLLTRQGFGRRYAELQKGQPAALLMLDLNQLKAINDLRGHGAGDQQILAVARALEANLPPGSVAARWGGDEFVVLMPGVSEPVARQILLQVADRVPLPQPGLAAFAFGATLLRADQPLERAIALADSRMYEAKQAQRTAYREARARRSDGSRPIGTLTEFSANLEALGSPAEIIDAGLRVAHELLGFDSATYFSPFDPEVLHGEYGPRGGAFVLSRLDPGAASQVRGMLGSALYRPENTSLVKALTRGRTVWSADYAEDPDAVADWVALGLKTCILSSVMDAGRPVGLIGLLSFSTWQTITPQLRETLEGMAFRVGQALERNRVAAVVEGTLEHGLSALGLALEARDLEPKGHTERVVRLADSLGRALGLRGRDLEELRQGAYLHDIGKLAVPEAVLLKPGPLDPDEWVLIRSHAAAGFQLASRISGISPNTLGLIRHHHERWDGSGYPDRLTGEAIPLAARIFAVCDAYDALISKRPYRRAWSVYAALEELQAQSGKQFDPRVTEAFFEIAVGKLTNVKVAS